MKPSANRNDTVVNASLHKTGASNLAHLLDTVNTALKAADYSLLKDLVAAQDHMISDLVPHTTSLTESEVMNLQKLADRNRRSLEATMRGIKAAHQRRREVEEISRSVQTYNRSGQRAALDPKNHAIEKRR